MVRQLLLSYKTALILLTLVCWAVLASPPTQAAVTLVYFQADSETGRVKLSWQTQYEDGTAGYRLERNDQAGNFLTVSYGGQNLTLVPSLGEFGGTYVAYDNTAVVGTTYTYTLYELTTSNVSRQLQSDQVNHTGTGGTTSGTATVTATITATPTGSSGFSTPTPTLTGGGVNPTSTPTPLITATKPPDDDDDDDDEEATPAGNVTSTPQTTTTPRPTGTAVAQVTPTAFPTSFPTTSFENGENVVSAEELTPPSPIDETGYPTPENLPPIQNEFGNEPTPYPVIENPIDPSAGVPTSVPPTNLTPAASGTARVGEGSVAPTPVPIIPTPAPETTTPNRVLLWVAFLVALGIFTAGVIGTTILFTRK